MIQAAYETVASDSTGASQTAALVAAVGLLIFVYSAMSNARGRYPKGPPGIPFAGNLWAILQRPKCEPLSQILGEWRKKYGDIYTIYLGAKPHVIVNGYENINECLVAKAAHFSDRPNTVAPFREDMHKAGMIFSHSWREQRKFVKGVFANYGFGKTESEVMVQREVSLYLEELQKVANTPTYLHDQITMAVCNVISRVILGQRWEYEDSEYLNFERNFRIMAITNYKMAWASFIPLISKLSPTAKKMKAQAQQAKMSNINFTKKILMQHMKTLDPDNPRDFVDYYLMEVKKNKEMKLENSMTEMNCVATILQLFSAGTNTTAMTLRWGFLYMMAYPDIQAKVQKEIDNACGDQELVMSHKKLLPYTEAVITEVLRMNHVAPLGLPKKANTDTSINGVFIPKDTTIYAHLMTASKDENLYPKPEEFRPERHIKDGAFVAPSKFIPFSIGMRNCLGESLARMELFLFFAGTLQRFQVTKQPNQELSFETYPDDSPKYQKCILVPRQAAK